MTPSELQTYLHTHIPLSKAMQVEVVQATPDIIELAAPLAPNINHRGTAFGGSISTLATLACWSLLRVRTDGLQPAPHLVVRRNNVEYIAPAQGEIRAIVRFPTETDWAGFLAAYAGKGRARVKLDAEVLAGDTIAAHFHGEFVAMR
ncbi:YiiD C-terminal domain-containing protein [Uliginosibacterium sp. 31-16]|uniref:YiiD C-terminal domain-containing protein n=1 Tax=Uliginosibacterium sp. 31-16 TaxID=3068315 RepID=UPI00273F41DA|nr:YiiD C-terminal domain-containing protein [Uliginosibacterium sp. 31-16]MDP5240481.1 YiiD C-terminal domain-containing protein [Uliginosibacterium sp. 31-16]